MKLYSGDLSPYSAKVRMQIYAKGIEDIALERPAGFGTPDWWKTSPIGRIPVLELDDGQLIPESEVIAEYLEEIFPTPRLLGATPLETARIRTVSRLADIYLINNMFLLGGQTRRSTRNEERRDLLAGQVIRGVNALEHYIGTDGFAVSGRLTIADCTLVPALFLIENVHPDRRCRGPDPEPAEGRRLLGGDPDERARRPRAGRAAPRPGGAPGADPQDGGRAGGGLLIVPPACWLSERAETRRSPIEGLGLFATAPIAAGEIVVRLGGVLIDGAALARLEPPYSSVTLDEDAHLLIDPAHPVRYGNHSCDPNLWHLDALTIAARRDIAAGEELMVDYGTHTSTDLVDGLPLRLAALSRARDRRRLADRAAAGGLWPALDAPAAATDRALARLALQAGRQLVVGDLLHGRRLRR